MIDCSSNIVIFHTNPKQLLDTITITDYDYYYC